MKKKILAVNSALLLIITFAVVSARIYNGQWPAITSSLLGGLSFLIIENVVFTFLSNLGA